MKEINVKELNDNVFEAISDEWMLVSAGSMDNYNMMTASWGTLGWLWNRPVAIVFVRPERYTCGMIESADRLTLSFLGTSQQARDIYKFCGSESGKDVDKMKLSGLTPKVSPQGDVVYEQSRLTLVGRKLYAQSMTDDSFVDKSLLERFYGEHGGMHRIFVVEIEAAYVAE